MGLGITDVIRPAVDELRGPVDPVRDHHAEVGEDAPSELVERGALGKGAATVEVGAG